MITAKYIFDPANKVLIESLIEIKACGNTDAIEYAPYIVDSMCELYPELDYLPNEPEIKAELSKMIIEHLLKYENSDVYWKLSGGLHVTEIDPLPTVEPSKAVILDTVALDCLDHKVAYVVRSVDSEQQAFLKLAYAIGYEKFKMLHFVAAHKIDCIEHIFEVMEESGEFEFATVQYAHLFKKNNHP